MSNGRVPDFEEKWSKDFRSINVDSIFGGISPKGAKVTIQTDINSPAIKKRGKPGQQELGKVIKKNQIQLEMSPVQFKSVVRWMQKQLKKYEETYGEIDLTVKGKKSEEGTRRYIG